MPHAVIAEFEADLAHWRQELSAADEMTRLWLVALAREQIVSVAYRGDAIEGRLSRMPISSEVRRVVARAIRWSWRDEEGHSLWMRGALLRRGTLPERARALVTQIEGRVGGWTSSRQSHWRWSEAPITRLAAELLELAGVAGGRIPTMVSAELHYQTFSNFCAFNVAAETTAGMAWRRMAELAETPGLRIAVDDKAAFTHMAEDEERHAKMFTLFAEAFDGEDRLKPGFTAELLTERLAAIGQRLLLEPSRGNLAWHNPLGKGARVVVREAKSLAERAQLLAALVDDIGLEADLSGRKIAIKTTFMLAVRRNDPSPAVAPGLIAELAQLCVERGATVSVIDARNVYDEFLRHRTVGEVGAYLGVKGPFELIDAQSDQAAHVYIRGLGSSTVTRAWRDADLRIVLGKLRSHPTGVFTGALEATEGLAARHDEHLFTERKAERDTAMIMLLDAFPPDIAIVDAFSDVPDGLLGMMGCHDPLQPRRLYGSHDAVALDAVLARHVGVDPEDDHTLVHAAFDWFGDPREKTTVVGIDAPIGGWRAPDHTLKTALLARLAMPVYQHASGRGALFVPETDETAFPWREPLHPAVAAARRAVLALTLDSEPHAHAGLLPTGWTSVGGGPVRVARLGSGPPVVCLHGYPENLQIWSRLAPLLAARHEVIAFDWPGLGHSAAWPGSAGPDARAEQLRALLDAWGLSTIDLIATDMGAQPALVFAAKYPERVGRVVVMNALLFSDGETSPEIALMRKAGLGSAAFALAPRFVYQRCKDTFLIPGETLPEALDADFLGAFVRPEVRRHLAKMCRDYEHELPGLPQRMWTLHRPVLALWAGDDHHFPSSQADRLAGLAADVREVILPGARHWMMWSRAEEVAAHVRTFLEV